jgi:hypothetical protein
VKTRILVSSVIVLTVLLVSAAVRGGSSDVRPAFAAEDRWIPLSDAAGLYVTRLPDVRKMTADGTPAGEAQTQLWVRVQRVWVPAHLEPSSGQFLPAR